MKRFSLCLISLLLTLPGARAADDVSTVAVYDLQGAFSESGQTEPSLLSLDFEAARPLTFHDLTTSLRQAASSPEVRAIVLEADDALFNLPQLSEIRRHLLAAREAGREVWIYSDYFNLKTAILGSAASQLVLMPEAQVNFTGIHAESFYLKGLLDRAGLRVEVVHIGDFKSFGEEFYRAGPSEFAARQTETLVDGLFEEMVDMLSSGRGLEPEKVKSLIDRGTFAAQEAVAAGLADSLSHRSDFNQMLREKYAEARFDRHYALPDRDGPEVNNIIDVFKLFMSSDDKSEAGDDYIAVVPMEGAISKDSITPARDAIIGLLDDEHAKALVLRVNSPGGSALASEVLWEATDEWCGTDRPFVVSMGATAASGGYYISAAADRIFAEPTTITGSIGVVGMKLVAAKAMERLGITTHSVTRGQRADAMSMTKPFDPQEREWVRRSMKQVDKTFKQRVRNGRGERLDGDLETLANGRVYTGRQALDAGLVDELGGLTSAIAWAAGQADLEPSNSRLVPEPRSPFEGLFSSPREKDTDELVRMNPVRTRAALRPEILIQSAHWAPLSPRQKAILADAFRRIRAIGESPVQLIGPSFQWQL